MQVQFMNLVVYGHQVSGKTSKFTDKTQKFIYKPYSEAETTFYEELQKWSITHVSYHLSKFVPSYFGVFTLSEILHEEDNLNSKHQHSNLPGEKLEPVQEIAKSELEYVKTSQQRKEWIEHINSRSSYENNQKFIKIKNLTFNFKYPNIMDLKLGIKKKNKQSNQRKTKTTTTGSHGFRINGLSVRQTCSTSASQDKIQEEIFLSKYYCQKISQNELNRHLGFFFFDGAKVHIKLLDKVIESLKELILGFMCYRGMIFESSSLYMAYDAYDTEKFTLNFIDFDKYHEGQGIDESVERGLKSCLRHFIEVRDQYKLLEKQLLSKEIMYYHTDHEVVPKNKQDEYKQRSKKNSPTKLSDVSTPTKEDEETQQKNQ